MSVKYPSQGFYRATLNWRNGGISLSRLTSQTYLYMRLRFADDPVGFVPQTDQSITSEVATIRDRYFIWSAGQLAIRATVTPTIDLPFDHAHYVTGTVNPAAAVRPGWTGMHWLIDDALAGARALGFDPDDYNVHSVRYSDEPGDKWSFGGGTRTWNRVVVLDSETNAVIDMTPRSKVGEADATDAALLIGINPSNIRTR